MPIGIAGFALGEACFLYLYFGQGYTWWPFVVIMWVGVVGIAFWVFVWLLATWAIRRNTPPAQKGRQET